MEALLTLLQVHLAGGSDQPALRPGGGPGAPERKVLQVGAGSARCACELQPLRRIAAPQGNCSPSLRRIAAPQVLRTSPTPCAQMVESRRGLGLQTNCSEFSKET